MRSLKEMVGENILACIPSISSELLVSLRLHGVTRHGIWVESQAFTDAMLRKFNAAASTTTLLLFIPFQRIDFILDAIGEVSLSEDAFLGG
jgi:hypothetical protein